MGKPEIGRADERRRQVPKFKVLERELADDGHAFVASGRMQRKTWIAVTEEPSFCLKLYMAMPTPVA